MKIAILTGIFPPSISGVGDHTVHLGSELRRQGHEVAIWAGEKNPERGADIVENKKGVSQIEGLSVFPVSHPWTFKVLRKVSDAIVEWNADRIIIQYTPQSVSSNGLGLNLGFSLWVQYLRRKIVKKKGGKKITLFAHELNYPVSFSIRGLLLGVPHVFQLALLLRSADQVYCSTDSFQQKLWNEFPWRVWTGLKKKVSWLPVGSNISTPTEWISEQDKVEFRRRYGVDPSHRILLHFGGLHPTHLYDSILHVLKKMEEKWGKNAISLVCVGAGKKEFEESPYFIQSKEIQSPMHFLGILPAEEISKWLQTADLVLAPFMDGISTRRGSAMAAFSHRKAVLTTSGLLSGNAIAWSEFCILVPVEDQEQYAQEAIKWISNPQELARIGESAANTYLREFDWPVWVRRMDLK